MFIVYKENILWMLSWIACSRVHEVQRAVSVGEHGICFPSLRMRLKLWKKGEWRKWDGAHPSCQIGSGEDLVHPRLLIITTGTPLQCPHVMDDLSGSCGALGPVWNWNAQLLYTDSMNGALYSPVSYYLSVELWPACPTCVYFFTMVQNNGSKLIMNAYLR